MNGIVNQIYEQIVLNLKEDELYLARSIVMDSLSGETDALELETILKTVSGNAVKFVWGKDFDKEVESVLPGELRSAKNLQSYLQGLKENVQNDVNNFLAQSIAVITADVVSSELMFDNEITYGYDYIIGEVQRRLKKSLDEFIDIHLMNEVNNMIEQMRKDI